MTYTHGTPIQGLQIDGSDGTAYKKYAEQYIAGELPRGTRKIAIDILNGWTIAGDNARPVDKKKLPERQKTRYIHLVRVAHDWELPPAKKDQPVRNGSDTHIFYFDATRALTETDKEKLEAAAGIVRPKEE